MSIKKITSRGALFCAVLAFGIGMNSAVAQVSNTAPARAGRPQPPARDPHTAGYVEAKELPDGEVPSADAEGNFIIGPTHTRAPEMAAQTNVPQGTIFNFTMSSADSKIYPGIG